VRRFLVLAIAAVLLAPAYALGTFTIGQAWDYNSSYLTEPTQGYYSQAAWSPWSAGYVSGGTFTPYDSFHWDPPNGDGAYHDAWFMMPGSGVGPDVQGAACKNVSGVVNHIDLGGGHFVQEEVGQTVMLTGNSGVATAVKWTAPDAGWYDVTAQFTCQSNVSGVARNVSVVQGSSTLNSGIIDGFMGTSGNSYLDGFDGTKGLRSASYTSHVSLAQGDAVTFLVRNDGDSQLDWVGTSFQVTSVPEPCAGVLVFSAVFGLLAYAWRKRR
jgi:hypothetical protein